MAIMKSSSDNGRQVKKFNTYEGESYVLCRFTPTGGLQSKGITALSSAFRVIAGMCIMA